MASDAQGLETARLKMENSTVTVHGGRIMPEEQAPTQAWTEHEVDPSSPGENRRLLPIHHKSRLQAGLTLGVHGYKHAKWPEVEKSSIKPKTKFQKRKDRLLAILKPPYFIVSMIVVIVFVYVWGSERVRGRLEWAPGAWRREPWRLLSYSGVHASASHLALNALVALAVGWRVEREQGWWRVAGVWGGGAAAGALGAGALQPRVRVVGASAAVYALLTAHLPNVCLRFGHIPLWWFRPLTVLVLGASEGCWALARAHHAHDQVAWAAHALGAAAGVPLAFLLFKGENDGRRYVFVARVISGLALVAGVVLASVHYTLVHETDRK